MNRISKYLAGTKAPALVAGAAGLACIALLMPATLSRSPASAAGPFKLARSPADLAATVFVSQEQGISQWYVRGVCKNIGGLDYKSGPSGPARFRGRTVTLQQVTLPFGNLRPARRVTLATKRVSFLKAGESVTLSTVLTKEPAAGTVFRLIISPGDLNADNDQAQRRYPR